MYGLVNVYPFCEIPWGPHIGLMVEIEGNPVANTAQMARCPKPLPSLNDLRKSHGFVEQISSWTVPGGKEIIVEMESGKKLELWSGKTEERRP